MKRVFIFEGPDGSGKTDLARALAARIDAIYTHHGSYLDFDGEGLANIYAVSLSPAVLGIKDVVLDRCWISEIPYGLARRNGVDRLAGKHEALEKFAMEKTRPLIIRCEVSWGQIAINYNSRLEYEYLEGLSQLEQVWKWYRYNFLTSLPQIVVWPFSTQQDTAIERILACLK